MQVISFFLLASLPASVAWVCLCLSWCFKFIKLPKEGHKKSIEYKLTPSFHPGKGPIKCDLEKKLGNFKPAYQWEEWTRKRRKIFGEEKHLDRRGGEGRRRIRRKISVGGKNDDRQTDRQTDKWTERRNSVEGLHINLSFYFTAKENTVSEWQCIS